MLMKQAVERRVVLLADQDQRLGAVFNQQSCLP
jgi:hypothetical protein